MFSFSNNNQWKSSIKYILKIHLSIITSQSCENCQIETIRSIESKLMVFTFQQQDGSSIIVEIHKPIINRNGM